MAGVTIDGSIREFVAGERLIDLINRIGLNCPRSVTTPSLARFKPATPAWSKWTENWCAPARPPGRRRHDRFDELSPRADAAQREAFDRILGNHMLYCTVCDNNNGNCTVHNTTKLLAVEHQRSPFKPKPYEVDATNPFYRYDPDQCILCGRCVEACQNVQVNETLSIHWEDPHPRVLWDGGAAIGESSCVSCGHCVTVCPCNALMEKSMLGQGRLFHGLAKTVLERHDRHGQGHRAGDRLRRHHEGFRGRSRHARIAHPPHEDRLHILRCRCSFDIWTKDRHILKVEPAEGPANGISTCIKGKFGWDFVNSPDRLTKPLIREGGKFREATWDEALESCGAGASPKSRPRTGPDSLAFISSSKCTNEESYLMQKLARAVIGTNNMDNCSRYCQAPGHGRPLAHGRLRRRFRIHHATSKTPAW